MCVIWKSELPEMFLSSQNPAYHRWVGRFFFVLLLACCLVACKSGNRNTLSIKVEREANQMRFECLASGSGSCYFVVFTSACSKVVSGDLREVCVDTILARLQLKTGDHQVLKNMPSTVRHCSSARGWPSTPDCKH